MVRVAAFGPGVPGSNPAGLLSWIQIKDGVFMNNTRGILLGGDKKPLVEKLWSHCVGIIMKIGELRCGKIVWMK